MKRKIKVPPGLPTSAEIIRDLKLTKADVKAVEALLARDPLMAITRKQASAKSGGKAFRSSPMKASKALTSSRTKAKRIRQLLAAKRVQAAKRSHTTAKG